MGIGPPVLALYRQLKDLGVLDSVESVMELGSQNVWCPDTRMVEELFAAFGRKPSPQLLSEICNANATSSAYARDVYKGLGMRFSCIDSDGRADALALDINFDSAPNDHVCQYDLVTNHGTTEHVFNQSNGFKMIHDLTKPGGYMLHALPFFGQWDHGFFNYQPNLFKWLAKYNSYKTYGIWLGIAWNLPSFIPWQPHLLDHLQLKSNSTGLLIVLQQKMYDLPFSIPFQEQFGALEGRTDEVAKNYAYAVDGALYSGNLDYFVTKDSLINKEVEKRLAEIKTRLDATEAALTATAAGLRSIENSKSWKVTAPLRRLAGYLRS